MLKTEFKLKKIFLIFAILFFSTSCSENNTNYLGLMDKGVLPLSDNNAFLGTNIFLSQELSNDKQLKGFFEAYGAPDAIQLQSSPQEELTLYYIKDSKTFSGAPFYDNTGNRSWIFRGPYLIPWQELKQVKKLTNVSNFGALFYIDNQFLRFSPKGKQPLDHIVQVILPTPKIEKKVVVIHRAARIKKKDKEETQNNDTTDLANATQNMSPLNFQNMNADQRALLILKGYAPRSKNGDIIHIVKNNENLNSISNWYTGNLGNVEIIAKENNLKANEPINFGTQIKIPYRLIKNDKIMPNNFK